jgi:hypothetical protein
MGEMRNAYKMLVGKPEGKRNIKMGQREVELEDVDWIGLAQDRDRWLALVKTVMNLRVP